ncbi:MAG: bifunctional homocysteine S-methyltransferase/methylenetetrahydrofolate reductase [Gemmatimonadota bacterium]|nr:bifunctional homocysteine S-methyltransferase/methylenetetrahydrofolate reductase [Gemmatimonadota bacterium]MDH3423459.1 bifunctional homocysteine S-methyltransferase/methylenetetrahydrofolate reductase [Gemmatimonadota bacterium]
MRGLIDDGRVHVFDGAMGTELYGRGVFVNICYDLVTLDQPELVKRIHREYVDAGAEIIETNTFGANPVKLSSYGLEERTEEINASAARLAREAAAERASVVGALGPLGVRLDPWGPTQVEEATDHFRRQVVGLLEGGVEGFVFETFADLAELECAYRAVRAESDLPVVAQMTVGEDRKTAYGTGAAQVARALTKLGVDVVGLNCSVGPAVMLDALEDMADATDLPLSAQPNAGLPRTVRDRQIYMASPDYMAEYARRMVALGVRFVGGCCGTTPEHVRRIREVVSSAESPKVKARTGEQQAVHVSGSVLPVPLADRSKLGARLGAGAPVLTVDILPPHGWNPSEIVDPARTLRNAGVHAVCLADSVRSRSRMSALSAATVIEREVGIETMVRYACRGREMFGMISDLLGAAAVGLRNVLIVSGETPGTGPYPSAATALDLDSLGLTKVIQGLNRGVDPGGNPIRTPTRFVQGVEVDPSAPEQEYEWDRFRAKIDAGADFAVTRPLFEPERLSPILELAAPTELPVVVGIWLLPTLRSAEFLANEVPGVDVPEETVERMRRADRSGPDAALTEGVAIALEVIEATRSQAGGFHFSAPRTNVEVAIRVVREAGLGSSA